MNSINDETKRNMLFIQGLFSIVILTVLYGVINLYVYCTNHCGKSRKWIEYCGFFMVFLMSFDVSYCLYQLFTLNLEESKNIVLEDWSIEIDHK